MKAVKKVISYDYSDLEGSQYCDAVNVIAELEQVYNTIKAD